MEKNLGYQIEELEQQIAELKKKLSQKRKELSYTPNTLLANVDYIIRITHTYEEEGCIWCDAYVYDLVNACFIGEDTYSEEDLEDFKVITREEFDKLTIDSIHKIFEIND